LSVTNCRPVKLELKSATKVTAIPTVIRLSTASARPTRRAGSWLTSSDSASGSQISIESVNGEWDGWTKVNMVR
jgi:hypothetical protein